jgi:phosphoglycerate dehydrogenase-like enzyme
VLVCDPIAEEGLDLLRRHFDVDVAPGLPPSELAERVVDYEALVVRSATRVDREVIERGERLKVVARAGSGLDNIDVEAALAHGVDVINSPDATTVAVAELTIGLILALARRIVAADAALKQGRWEKGALIGTNLAGKTLGVVGFGRIGRAVATRARAFGMRIVTNQRRPTPELYLEAGVEPLDLYDLLAQSDFVTLHVPLRDDTKHLIGRRELRTMKPTAYLVNTSRGEVVDEEALLEALESGVIAGAALDVFSREPATDHPLARHPKVVATPHIGASTTDAQAAAAVDVARQLVELLASQTVRSVLPIRFVAADAVVAHEATDPRRVERLARRIETEGLLRNPPVVARLDERWVVLDGATRTAALASLRCPHLVVQDVEIDEVAVETWHHVVRDVDPERLRATLDDLAGVTVAEVDPSQAAEAVAQYGGICTITAPDRWCLVAYPRPGVSRFDALTEVVDAYLPEAVVSRVADTDLRRLRAWYPDLAALVEFPEFTVSQVLAAARSGRVLPAGVTRFLIPGRVLRLNVPLDWLREPTSLEEKNRRLHDLLAEKERLGEIRYYREPVYLLDE